MKNHAYKCYLSLEITILANEERERERERECVCLCVMIPVVGAKVCVHSMFYMEKTVNWKIPVPSSNPEYLKKKEKKEKKSH